jgi:hypothetical protein
LRDGIERPTYWDSFLEPLNIFTTKFIPNKISNQDLYQFELYREKCFNYQILPVFSSNMMFYGYWQSYIYFDHVKNEIFKMIRLDKIKENVKSEYERYFDETNETISMHFRLGDYKKKTEYHPILPYSYYLNSLQHILIVCNEKKSDSIKKRVLYFCEKEDNHLVLDMVQKLNQIFPDVLFIKVDDSIMDWKQMILMSCCDHNIIANSTFSWWGAYMNDSTKKIVCYPSLWFGVRVTQARSHDDYMKDLYPDDWIKINI